jgi:beta-mannosidase
VARVNNQIRQYTFDVSELATHNNLTIAFESACYYGWNVTGGPDAEYFPNGEGFSTREWPVLLVDVED